MRIVEICPDRDSYGWTLEIHEEFEKRIAVSLGKEAHEELTDDEIKSFFMERVLAQHEMLSLEIVKD